jgi:hypothetical protein
MYEQNVKSPGNKKSPALTAGLLFAWWLPGKVPYKVAKGLWRTERTKSSAGGVFSPRITLIIATATFVNFFICVPP